MQVAGLEALEAMDESGADMVAEYADCIQIGARNMQNYSLLKTVGRIGKPVLLKRGFSATINDLLLTALAQILLKKAADFEVMTSSWIVFFGSSAVAYVGSFLLFSRILKYFALNKIYPAMTIAHTNQNARARPSSAVETGAPRTLESGIASMNIAAVRTAA